MGSQFLSLLVFFALPVAISALRLIQLLSELNNNYVTVYWPDGAVRIDSGPYTHASTFEVHEVPNSNSQW